MDINKLLEIGKIKKLKAEDVIFSEHEEGEEMYIILQGRVGVYSYNIDGSRVQLAELKPGDFFGEMALVDQQKRSADVQAVEGSTLFVIDSQNFEQVVSAFPDLAINIMKGMSLRIRELNSSYKDILKTAKSLEPHRDDEIKANKHNNIIEQIEQEKMKQEEQLLTKSFQKNTTSKGTNGSLKQTESAKQSANRRKRKLDYGKIFAEDTYKNYLIRSTVECPVCEKSFETNRIRHSLLKQSEEDRDFRIRYHDFEPYWYKVWVCPHCYYSNFDQDFYKVHYLKKKEILSRKNEIKSKYPMKWGEKKNLEQVIAELLLSQEIHNFLPKDRIPYAKVWLYLSWLYDDVNDFKRFEFSNKKAVLAYVDFYSNEVIDLPRGQEIRLCLLIAELYKKQSNYGEALKYLHKAVQMRTEPQRLKQLATDRLIEYKKLKDTSAETK